MGMDINEIIESSFGYARRLKRRIPGDSHIIGHILTCQLILESHLDEYLEIHEYYTRKQLRNLSFRNKVRQLPEMPEHGHVTVISAAAIVREGLRELQTIRERFTDQLEVTVHMEDFNRMTGYLERWPNVEITGKEAREIITLFTAYASAHLRSAAAPEV